MAELNSQDSDPPTRQPPRPFLARVNYVLHETIIRGLGVLLEGYRTWLRSHRPPQ